MTFPLDARRRGQYLERLGFDEPPPVDANGLKALHHAHLRSFPFENLDIHLGREIHLDGEHILTKLLGQRRGGYCYELNGAFASLLDSLGFDVCILEAQVYDGDDVGIRFDHACVSVGLSSPRLVDVGFGACFHNPLELRPGIDQPDPAGVYRLERRAGDWLDLSENGQPQYRLSLIPRALADFEDGNAHQQTSPSSHFTKNTVCSRATERGRVTLRGLRLIETVGEQRTETDVEPAQLGEVLAERFGIRLPAADIARLADAD